MKVRLDCETIATGRLLIPLLISSPSSSEFPPSPLTIISGKVTGSIGGSREAAGRGFRGRGLILCLVSGEVCWEIWPRLEVTLRKRS
jgi:hypothetical protein